MKTKFCAALFAVAFAAGIGFPAAAADDASGVTTFHASGPSAATEQVRSLSTMLVVKLSPQDLAAIIGARSRGETAAPVVSGPGAGVILSGVTEWDLTPEDFINATR